MLVQWNFQIMVFGTSHFVLYREVVLLWRLKGPQSVSFVEKLFYCVLYSECPLSTVKHYEISFVNFTLCQQPSQLYLVDSS